MGNPMGEPMSPSKRGELLDETNSWLKGVFGEFDAHERYGPLNEEGKRTTGIVPEFEHAVGMIFGKDNFSALGDFEKATLKRAILEHMARSKGASGGKLEASIVYNIIAAIPPGQISQTITNAHNDGKHYHLVSDTWEREWGESLSI